MSTPLFITQILFNCMASFIFFGFKYFWKMFKCLRGKPYVISQLKGIALAILPVILVLRFPIYILFTIYCFAAVIYGIRTTYTNDIEYEKRYFDYVRVERQREIDEAWDLNNEEEARRRWSQAEEQTESQTENTETVNETTASGYCPFDSNMTMEEAKNKYHKLLKMGHPDNDGDEDFTKFITEQYEEFCKAHANA